jgi:NADPH2:quinone reductase
MHAVRCHVLEGPEKLRYDDVEPPTPGDGEVAIDVHAAGVNFPDVLITQGKYQFQPALPFVPGNEVAGVVHAVGKGVTRVKAGDRVAASMIFGAFAERVVVPEGAAIPIPEGVADAEAAACLVTYGTMYHGLVERAALQKGETVLVLGAAGGVGLAAVDLAKALGARVIAAASSAEKLEVCRALGADALIDYGKESLKDRAKALSSGGVDVVVDPVGGDYADAALRATGWNGRYLVIGFASGNIPRVPLNLVLLKGCQIVGVFWGMAVAKDPEKNRQNVAHLFQLIVDEKLHVKIDETLPFSKTSEALQRIARREVKGKLVLVPDGNFPRN